MAVHFNHEIFVISGYIAVNTARYIAIRVIVAVNRATEGTFTVSDSEYGVLTECDRAIDRVRVCIKEEITLCKLYRLMPISEQGKGASLMILRACNSKCFIKVRKICSFRLIVFNNFSYNVGITFRTFVVLGNRGVGAVAVRRKYCDRNHRENHDDRQYHGQNAQAVLFVHCNVSFLLNCAEFSALRG